MVLSLGLPLDQRGVSPRRPPMSPASKENANPVRNASPAGFVLSSNLRGAELPASTQLKNVEEMEKSVAGFNEFVAAAEVGDVRKVRDLLRRGADINKPDGDGWTALIAAAAEGHLEVVKMLLVHSDVDVNLANKDNESALMRAVLAGHAQVATALLSAPGIEVNAKTSAGKSALIIAAGCGQAAIASALLVADDIEVNATDGDGKTALIRACEAGHAEIALSLLVTDGVEIDLADAAGKTAKMHALARGHERIVGLIEEMQKEDALAPVATQLTF